MDFRNFYTSYDISDFTYNIINFYEEKFIGNLSFKIQKYYDDGFLNSNIDLDLFIKVNQINFKYNGDFSILVDLIANLTKIQNLISNRFQNDKIYLKNFKIKHNYLYSENPKSLFFKFIFEIQGIGTIESYVTNIISNKDIIETLKKLNISDMISINLITKNKY